MANATPPAIEIENLGKVFRKRRSIGQTILHPFEAAGEVRALDGVSFSVRSGEIFGLLGPNGAGKTTLLKILSCLVSPTSGFARVQGHDTAFDEHRVKSAIGLVTSDERSFYWRLTGRENLHFFASIYNVPRDRIRPRCQELLQKMEMAPRADQPFMEYSTGTKQRLAIARALLHDPPVIFMDEPTRSLDPTAAKHLREFVVGTLNRKEGKTVLLATHNLPEAEALCSRLVILHLAKVRRFGTMEEVRSWETSRERYAIEIAGLSATRILEGGDRALSFAGCALEVRAAGPGSPADRVVVDARVDAGGAALTELLRRLLAAGGTIVSCSRREASLQEVFDLVAGEGGEP
ncbi:MAG TPA: ABC transporter ATP-binding protein [Verrucomicrobiae bacterium]|nr:ABC transporter ATP-binding protein [Verrucomicrobiae bacterium]